MENNLKPDFGSKTPCQILGVSIVEKLIQEKFIDTKDSIAFVFKLSTGKVKESDWRVEFNAALNSGKL